MSGLKTTLAVLGQTKNEAAIPVLLAALDAPNLAVQSGTMQALLERRGPAGARELLKRWHKLSERWKKAATDQVGKITGVIRDGILSGDEQTVKNACDAVLWVRDYDFVPVLVNAALDGSNPQAELAADTVIALCDSLCEELATSRDYKRRDPQLARRHVVTALEPVADRFDQHKNKMLLEAFLMLVNRENLVLNRILEHPHDPAYATMMHLLASSPRPGVMRLLLNYMDVDAPSSIYSVLARRSDLTFVRHFLKRFAGGVRPSARSYLKRVESFGWLEDGGKVLAALDDEEQRGAIQLAMRSGMSRLQAFVIIRAVLRSPNAATRRCAAEQLGAFRGTEANELILQTLEDEDPEVQSHVVRLLRDHNIPGAIAKLTRLLDSPNAGVRDAVRESLSEFTLPQFLAAFDNLDEESKRERGEFVRRVDPNAIAELKLEMQADSRSRRRRAVAVAVAIHAVEELQHELIRLLNDDDHVVRATAESALQCCSAKAARAALRQALLDANAGARPAAEDALQDLAQREDGSMKPPALTWPVNDGTTHSGAEGAPA
jgi:HEAT repeat protein